MTKVTAGAADCVFYAKAARAVQLHEVRFIKHRGFTLSSREVRSNSFRSTSAQLLHRANPESARGVPALAILRMGTLENAEAASRRPRTLRRSGRGWVLPTNLMCTGWGVKRPSSWWTGRSLGLLSNSRRKAVRGEATPGPHRELWEVADSRNLLSEALAHSV